MNRQRWFGVIAMVTTATLASLIAGCEPADPDKGTSAGPADPLSFVANGGPGTSCVYTFDPGGSPADPDFTFADGQGGITVSASYAEDYQGPPNAMEITYGDPDDPEWGSGLLTLFPSDPEVTLIESSPTDWSMTYVRPTGGSETLPYGLTWTIRFDCGALTSCCDRTFSVQVRADGSP